MEDRDERPEAHTIDPGDGREAHALDDATVEGPPAGSGDAAVAGTASRRPLHARARIEGVEAGVAAGLVPAVVEPDDADIPEWSSEPSPSAVSAPDDASQLDGRDGEAAAVQPASPVLPPVLPDWRDPPTREVPRILLDQSADPNPSYPGPVWREVEADWDDDDLTFAEIVHEGSSVADHGLGVDEPDPFAFDFTVEPTGSGAQRVEQPPEPEEAPSTPSRGAEPYEPAGDEGSGPLLEPHDGPTEVTGAVAKAGAARHGGRGTHRARVTFAGRGRHDKATVSVTTAASTGVPSFPRHTAVAPPPSSSKRNPVVATVTGLAVGIAVLLIFLAGPVAVLALVTVVLVVAAAECYQSLRRARYRPAVLVGLLGVAGVAVAGYEKGTEADLIGGAAVVIAALCWYLFGITRRSPVANFAATVMVWAWVGLMGGFATLLIAPRTFPHRHGLAYLLGAIVATVAYDVGGYAFGSWVGSRRLAPSISPNKTVEGLLGGCFTAVAISVAIVGHMHPWTIPHALELGLVVAVFAPLGDLAESMIKRDVGVKDMGTLLPAHGGLLDRIDALLFVLPATYCLVRLFHG